MSTIEESQLATEKPLIERLAANEPRFSPAEIGEMLKVSPEVVVKWHRRGVGGVRLKMVKVGGSLYAFYKELSEFLETVAKNNAAREATE